MITDVQELTSDCTPSYRYGITEGLSTQVYRGVVVPADNLDGYDTKTMY